METDNVVIAVVIPCYKVKRHILSVISGIGQEVSLIYVIDDKCPEETGFYVQKNCDDPRVRILFNDCNLGVGGATISGYHQAILDGATIVVKIDGDNQMDTSLVYRFVNPILNGTADYTKGNRFYDIESLSSMPRIRLFGNSVLSLINKISSGYWNIMDPTNGYTAIHSAVLRRLPLHKLDQRYFFESDMLFRLNIIRAVVEDIPIEARYGGEISNLKTSRVVFDFPRKYLGRFFKRIFYDYFLRDFNAGTIQMVAGLILLLGGVSFGSWKWYISYSTGIPATSGIVMIAALPILLGFHLIISMINYDIAKIPKACIHKILSQNGSKREIETLKNRF